MSQKNIRRLIFKSLVCLSALPVLMFIFTSKASLQSTNANVRPRPATTATPRRSPRSRANTVVSNIDRDDYTPEPTPTPIPANSTVRGRVFYADTGRAVKRASIILLRDDGSSSPSNSPSGLTDSDGNFQLKKVRAGAYYAMISAPGIVSPLAYADFSRRNDREAMQGAFENFQKITVDGVTDLDVQIPAQRGGAIGGRVMYDDGDPAIGVRVEILRKVDDRFVSVIPNLSAIMSIMSGNNQFQTDDRGVYRFSSLPPGDYIVKVTESAMHGENPAKSYYDPFEITFGNNSFLTVFFPDASNSKEAQPINVQLGQEISEINLTLPSRRLYKLEGKIIDRKDKTPVKAQITIKPDAREEVSSFFSNPNRSGQNQSLTDEDGNWKFKELPKGTYKLIVEPVETESDYYVALGDSGNANRAAKVERNNPAKPKLAKKVQVVTIEDEDLTKIVVEVGYGATVSGSARVENSEEMPGNVTIIAVGDNNDTAVTTSINNYSNPIDPRSSSVNRRFKLENVVEGKNQLSFIVENTDYYVKSATLGGTDLLASPIEVKEGDALSDVQIVLAKDTGTLQGVIVNDDKQPVKGLEFSIIPTDASKRKQAGFYRQGRSDENGEFTLKAAPGEYAIVFFNQSVLAKNREDFLKWIDETLKDAQLVKIETGKTETVTIKRKF